MVVLVVDDGRRVAVLAGSSNQTEEGATSFVGEEEDEKSDFGSPFC